MTQTVTSKIISQIVGVIFGSISILAGIAAWGYGSSREPARYNAAAIVMILGGILWIVYFTSSNYKLSRKQITVILVTLVLGSLVYHGRVLWSSGYSSKFSVDNPELEH
jgi:hypothetical protein